MNDVTSDVAMTTDAEHAVKAQFCHHMGTAEKVNVNFVLITLLFFFPAGNLCYIFDLQQKLCCH